MRNLMIAAIIIAILGSMGYFFSKKSNQNPRTQVAGEITPTAAQTATPTPAEPLPSVAPTTFPDGLKIEDLKVGEGKAVKSGDTISINYAGTLTDGTKFDSSYDRGTPFETQIGVGQVIKGWDEGVIGMKAGGKRRLTIPGNLAYGPQGIPGSIPPNATLIFDVELMGIQ